MTSRATARAPARLAHRAPDADRGDRRGREQRQREPRGGRVHDDLVQSSGPGRPPRLDGGPSGQPWHLEVTLDLGDNSYTSRLLRTWERRWSANVLEHAPLVMPGSRLVPRFTDERGLELTLRPAPLVAEVATLDGRRLDITMSTDPELVVSRAAGGLPGAGSVPRRVRVPGPGRNGPHPPPSPTPTGRTASQEFDWQLRRDP